MGIMDFLKGMGEDKAAFRERFKEVQQNERVQEKLNEMKKSSNQRFLERHVKEQREERFKEEVAKINKQHSKDSWKGESILKGHTSILKEDKKALANGKSIMFSKNIFIDNKTKIPITNKGGMFFK